MLKPLLAAVGVALPLAAIAGDREAHEYVVDIEYWGTVNAVIAGEDVKIGDPLRGTMTLVPRLAPRDADRSDTAGDYAWNPLCEGDCPPRVTAPSYFVSSNRRGVRGESGDRVLVGDNNPSASPLW